MKVAYISVYRDGTGYGDSALEYIKALDHVGVDVVPIWVTLSGQPHVDPGEKIKSLERKSLDDVDVIIQHITPNMFCRKEGVKNIGMFYWETTSFRGSGWTSSCNLMDEIWVVNEEQRDACIRSGVTVPIKVVLTPRNIERYNKEYEKLEFNDFVDDTFKFYTISDISHRKNVFGLVNTYLNEFDCSDNVSLILKCYVAGKTFEESTEYVKSLISEIKANTRKPDWSFPRICMSKARLSEDEMMSLHKTGDCFVTATRGEGDCLPAVDAAFFGNPVIAGNWNGIRSNFENTRHPLINKLEEKNVVGMKNQLERYYNSDETWFEPSSIDMAEAMRDVYTEYDYYHRVAKEDICVFENKFSYEKTGTFLAELLKGDADSD